MKKSDFNLIIRFLVGTALSLLICAGMIMTGKLSSNKPLIQQASGLKLDETVMTVDGTDVTAEEYLYMVSYSAQSLSYYGITDLSTQLGESYTAADYVAEDTRERITQQMVIRNWADEMGIRLTEDDEASLDEQRAAYGSEEDFQKALKITGISETLYNQLMSTSLLYNRLYEAYCSEGGELRSSDKDLTALGADHGLMTADVLFIATAELDDAGKADARALLGDYVRQLRAAEDPAAAFAALETSENVTVVASNTYDGCEETVLNTALADLEVGQVSDVFEDENGVYVALRRDLDLDAVAEMVFSEDLTVRLQNAQVEMNESVYNRIDIAGYYSKMNLLQQNLYNQLMPADGE